MLVLMPGARATLPKVGAAGATGVRSNTTPGVDGKAMSHARSPCARLGNGARKPVRVEFGSQTLWRHDCAQRGVAHRRSWRDHWTNWRKWSRKEYAYQGYL